MTIVHKIDQRIDTLDGFRFLAIISVILYHYYTLYTPPLNSSSLYPYGSSFNYFRYGYLGVEFFFIISGFVIAHTLTTTRGLMQFWKKRFVRLFPAMLICSLITYTVFNLWDNDNLFPRAHSFVNLLYSLTFINPGVLDNLLKFAGIKGTTLVGSYWSLWPEIQFYVVASLIYFFNPAKFSRNFFVFVIVLFVFTKTVYFLTVMHWDLFGFPINSMYKLTQIFNFSFFSIWFLVGVIFYRLYTGKRDVFTVSALCIAILFQCLDGSNWKIVTLSLFMDLLFLVFIFYPQYLKFLRAKFITSIGLASYSLYLIHEYNGLLLIHKLGAYFGSFSFLFPAFVILIFSGFSMLLYSFVEKPLTRKLKSKFSTAEYT
jgi:peptidoglycan/LPS O-acetylase OafA/YrhL